MKKILFLILILSAANSCSNSCNLLTKNFDKPSKDSSVDLPDWDLNPYLKNGVAAVGLAFPTQENQTNEARILFAEKDARIEISNIIHGKFSRITKDILEQIDFKNPAKVKKIFDEATKEVVENIQTSKASRVNIFNDKYGVLYVQLFLKNKDYQESAKDAQEIYQNHVDKSRLSNVDLEKANEAIKALFGYSKHQYYFHRVDLY